jgi:nucleoside-diphosphate-sugar epimerase
MRLLLLGGTAWLGRATAAVAVGHGHEVTCLARGDSGEVPAEARFVRADRDRADAYDGVAGERWDAVIDVARQPGHVRRAVATLESIVGRYLFVSSANVYASHRELDQDEGAPLLPPLASDVMASMEQYGRAKVACEQAVTAAFGPDRTLIARAGLIGGPGDWSGRSGYWPWRFARPSNPGRAVLVPDAPELPTAVIDVRDLAAWLVTCAVAGRTGVFNAGGIRMPLADHLTLARTVAGHTGPLVSASTEWLLEHGVQNWSGPTSLPLWLDDSDWYGVSALDTSRARAAGLLTRPPQQTLADTLIWELSRAQPGPHGAGLTDEEERNLLDALATVR